MESMDSLDINHCNIFFIWKENVSSLFILSFYKFFELNLIYNLLATKFSFLDLDTSIVLAMSTIENLKVHLKKSGMTEIMIVAQ
jgi:hypothetical protein